LRARQQSHTRLIRPGGAREPQWLGTEFTFEQTVR
jgi:hypothetical protein